MLLIELVPLVMMVIIVVVVVVFVFLLRDGMLHGFAGLVVYLVLGCAVVVDLIPLVGVVSVWKFVVGSFDCLVVSLAAVHVASCVGYQLLVGLLVDLVVSLVFLLVVFGGFRSVAEDVWKLVVVYPVVVLFVD